MIWMERNKRIFSDKIEDCDILWEKVKFYAVLSLVNVKEIGNLTFSDFLRDWRSFSVIFVRDISSQGYLISYCKFLPLMKFGCFFLKKIKK